jgi:hypothetical protein
MPIPSLEFLFDASKRSLEDAELAELNRSSNFAKAMRVEMDAWVEACAAAMVTRWMMDNREALLSRREVGAEPKKIRKLFDQGKSNSA